METIIETEQKSIFKEKISLKVTFDGSNIRREGRERFSKAKHLVYLSWDKVIH